MTTETSATNGAPAAAPTGEIILEVKNLKMYFPVTQGIIFQRKIADIKAVDGLNLFIRKGETLGLVGESGCGKTTTGRAILQLYRPTAGEVFFEGTDLTKLTNSQIRPLRRRMQIIFQDPSGSLNPRMTVESALIEPMAIQRIGSSRQDRRDRAAALLEEVDLETAHLRRYPHEFSGGQR